jgi:hypothetical protein
MLGFGGGRKRKKGRAAEDSPSLLGRQEFPFEKHAAAAISPPCGKTASTERKSGPKMKEGRKSPDIATGGRQAPGETGRPENRQREKDGKIL